LAQPKPELSCPKIQENAMRLFIAAIAASLLSSAAMAEPSSAPSGRPVGAETLFWSQAQKEEGFPHMEKHFAVHVVSRGAHVRSLPVGNPLKILIKLKGRLVSIDAFMEAEHTAGLLIVKDGKIRLEKYRLGYGPEGRWTSFSVAKSLTSTLVGAAIKDGYIQSVDDPVTRYIPGLKGSAYEGVTVKQLLTMTSGVKWNESYTDPKSDVAQLFTVEPDPGVDSTVSYMRKLPREAEPGTKWVYKTGETNLIGVLVTSATHKTLADYLSQTLWKPYGMEQDAVWMVDGRGQEPGGCCISVSLHDYARIGQFVLDEGRVNGNSILPAGWIKAATHKQVEIGEPGHGYGYQWWTRDDGAVDAEGIFGQDIHINPKQKLVVVVSSAWPIASDPEHWRDFETLFKAIEAVAAAEGHKGS